MKKVIFGVTLILLLVMVACASGSTNEYDTLDDGTALPNYNYTQITDYIPIKTPFAPLPGNVILLSHHYFNTLIFTDDSIWRIPDAITHFSKPVRVMDTVDNIERVIESSHVLTTNQTLYFLDFDNGEVVKQLENVASLYHFHVGTVSNPLHYAKTADGIAWRVDAAKPIRMSDDYIVRCGMPGPDRILDIVSKQWFENVRDTWGLFVLTEDDVLWEFDSWKYDAVPTEVMVGVRTIAGGVVVTTDNMLLLFPPWDEEEVGFRKIKENVKQENDGLILTKDNELWWYYWQTGELFKIAENVKSVQRFFGFLTMDDTLWWLPNWWRAGQERREPIKIKENVLRTWWNWQGSEYIITKDGSLWLFNYEDNYFMQIFQGTL